MLSTADLALLLLEKVFAFMALGALFARFGFYTPAVTRFVLRNFVVRLLLPLLIFEKVVGTLSTRDAAGMALSFGGALAMVFGASALARLSWVIIASRREPAGVPNTTAREARNRSKRSFVLVNSFHNYGFIAYPLILELYGSGGLALAFVFALTCDALFWSYGVSVIDGHARVRWSEVINPPFVTVLLSVTLAFWGLRERIPGQLSTFLFRDLGVITAITIPLALSTVGGAFFHSLRTVRGRPPDTVGIVLSVLLRALVLPAFFLTLFLLLPPTPARSVLLVEAVMPASIGVVILSALYDGDHAFIVIVSVISNLLGLLTIPLYLGCVS